MSSTGAGARGEAPPERLADDRGQVDHGIPPVDRRSGARTGGDRTGRDRTGRDRAGDDGSGRTSLAELLAGHVVSGRVESEHGAVLLLAPASSPATPSTVVKLTHGTPHSGSGAETLYRLHRRLVAATAPGSAAPAARPVGWGAAPDLFACEYLPGITVKERMELLAADSAGAQWPAEMSAIARAAGAVLARFHLALQADGADDASPRVGRLLRYCRRAAFGTPRHLPDFPDGRVRSLCDPGPHNLILTPDGELRLIDLPTDERWTFAEFDLGVLGHRLARRAAIAFASGAGEGEVRRVFVEPLCEGYAEAGGRRPDLAEVLAAFGASSLVFAKRSLTIGHHASLRYARRDVSWGAAALCDARSSSTRAVSSRSTAVGTGDG